MKIPHHLALSFLLAQFGVQQQFGAAGMVLVLAAGILPDVDRLSVLGGWNVHRKYRTAAGHGLPLMVAVPWLLGLCGSEVLGLVPLTTLWFWLQLSWLVHLATDILCGHWPVQLLWPWSARRWHIGLVERDHPVPGLLLYAAAVAALCSTRTAPVAAGVGIGGLTLFLAWRAFRPRPRRDSQPELGPLIWEGCDFVAWVRLLARNRFAVHPSRWRVAAVITLVSLVNSALRLLRCILYRRSVWRASLPQAPIFIVGHWRTGTTLLHELLVLDPHHVGPSTYECLAPSHFLLTESWLPRLLWFLIPSLRPMDNMAAGWARPQEDELALCILGQPSPYERIAFPNRARQVPEALDLDELEPRALARWKRVFLDLLRQFALRNPGKRLVLKSPTHTCRIAVLLELFPEARFVHIVRDPYFVFPSTLNLWQALYQGHGLQQPTFEGLEEQIFQTYSRLYEKLEATRSLVAPSHFHELRYEDLVRDPVGQVRTLYHHLGMEGFDAVLPRLQTYAASVADYRANRYDLSPDLHAQITRRWREVIHRYGYGQVQG